MVRRFYEVFMFDGSSRKRLGLFDNLDEAELFYQQYKNRECFSFTYGIRGIDV